MPYIYSHEALSGEARAARGWTGAAQDRRWISMQLSTFRNWVNEQLAKADLHSEDLALDFCDGTYLIALVEVLQNRKCRGRIFRKHPTEIQALTNIQLALDAMQDDGVKLVNIGSYDIKEGNLKLLLGLIWCLILRYQIAGKTKIPPKKLMLAWLQAVLPELTIRNFKSDWNDGIGLSALLEYCRPGLFPDWRSLSKGQAIENCERAMQIAKEEFGIPMVLSPEDMSSPNLDELSCMTYLSYFMKEYSPGYQATLFRVRKITGTAHVSNFTRDWNDGFVLCQIVYNLGGNIPGWPNLVGDQTNWIKNNNFGIAGARQLGVEPVLSAQELADREVEHLAVMVYAARLCNVKGAKRRESPKSMCHLEPLQFIMYHTQQQVNLDVVFLDKTLTLADIEAFVSSSSGFEIQPQIRRTMKGAVISFTPYDPGVYQVRAYCFGEDIKGSPVPVHVVSAPTPSPTGSAIMPPPPPVTENEFIQQQQRGGDINKVSFSGLSEPCAVGSIVEVVINAHGTSTGIVLVEASSPSGKLHKCQVIQKGSTYTATFNPNEVGEWQIAILYDGEHIRGSPFSCFVYDANLVQVYGLDVGVVGQELKFNVNTSQAGRGDLNVTVLHHGRNIPNYVERQGPGVYRVQFTPDGAGQYKIHIYFNNMEIKGSPFILDIVDASSVSVYGDNLRMASVDKLSSFMIHAVGADAKDLSVTINAPSGKKKRARVIACGDSTYQVEWKPFEAGEHYIDVRLYNQPVQDSPFACNVGDPDLVTVRNIPSQIKDTDLGEPVAFEIDASAAGSGNLEIMINGGRVPCTVREMGSRNYLASFVPNHPISHVLEMRFNGDVVKGSPWRIEVSVPQHEEPPPPQAYVLAPANLGYGPQGAPGAAAIGYQAYSHSGPLNTSGHTTFRSEVERELVTTQMPAIQQESAWVEIHGLGLQKACVGKVASFEFGARGIRSDDIHVRLTSPTGKDTPCKIIAARTGNFRCEYVATEIGSYRMDISINGRPIQGSPFAVATYAPHKVQIDPIPGGAVGKPVQFFVDASEAGKGQLEISINHGRVPNNVQMQGAGRCLVTFIPSEPGTYVVEVTFNGDLVRGCPARVEVHESRQGSEFGSSVASESGLRPVEPRYPAGGVSPRGASSSSYRTSHERTWSSENRSLPPPAKFEDSSYLRQNGQTGGLSPRVDETISWSTKSYLTSAPKATGQPEGVYPARPANYENLDRFPSNRPPAHELHDRAPPSKRTGGFDYQETRTEYRAEPGRVEYLSTERKPEPPPHRDLRRSPSPRVEKVPPIRREVSPEVSKWREEKALLSRREPSPDEEARRRAEYEDYERRRQEALMTAGTTVARYDDEAPPPDRRPRQQRAADFRGKTYDERLSEWRIAESKSNESQPPLPRETSAYIRHEEEVQPREISPPRAFARENQAYVRREPEPPREISPPRVKSPEERQMEKSRPEPPPAPPRSPSPIQGGPPAPPAPTEAEIREARVEGPAIGVIRLQKSSYFDIRPLHCDKNQLKVIIQTPSKKNVEPKVRETRNGFIVEFMPQEVGTHKVHVTVNNLPHPNSPFPCKVYEPENIFVSKIPDGSLGQPVEFTVDASAAGYGNLEIAIKDELDNIVPSNVTPISGQHTRSAFLVSFIPNCRGVYLVHISFNGEGLDNSPFACAVEGKIEPKTIYPLGHGDEGPPVEVESPDGPPPPPPEHRKIEEIPPPPEKEPRPVLAENGHGPRPESPERPPSPKREAEPLKQPIIERREEMPRGAPPPKDIKGADALGLEDVPKLVSVESVAGFRVTVPPGPGHLAVEIVAPNGEIVPAKIIDTGSSTFKAEFVPRMVGDHNVSVRFADVAVTGSPFMCRVYDARKIKIGEIPNGFVGKSVHFVVDASEAGVGNLEVAVNEGRIPSMAHSLGQHRYDISFVPREPEDHTISIRFNNEAVPGSPFACKMVTSSQATASGPGLDRVPVKKITHFILDLEGPMGEKPEITIKDSTGQPVPMNVSLTPNNTYRVEFSPQVVGNHQIHVKFGENPISGSPFTAKAYDASKVKLHPVEGNVVGRPSSFYIDAAKAGAGNMEIIVSVDGRNVPNFVQAEGNAKFKVSFTPQEPKPHLISVKFNGESVPGSPMSCSIIDGSQCVASGDGLRVAPISKTAWFTVDPRGEGGGDCNVVVTGPSQHETEVEVKESDGVFQVTYIPVEIGPHKINVVYAEHEVNGSPFFCNIFDPEKVKLTKIGPGIVNKPVIFEVDTSKAGDGLVEIEIRSSKGPPISANMEGIGMGGAIQRVKFTPLEKSPYYILVKFNGYPVGGGPQRCDIVDASQCQAYGDGLKVAQVDQVASFFIDVGREGMDEDLGVKIVGPSRQVLPCSLRKETGTRFQVEYIPVEVGHHTLDISYAAASVPGSPFSCEAFDLSAVKVKGLKDDQVGREQKFTVDYSNAGKGYVDVNVTYKSQKVQNTLQNTDINAKCSFVPKQLGIHKVDVLFNGILLPECPYQVYIRDTTSIRAEGPGLKHAAVQNTANFTVVMDGAGRGELDVVVTASDGGAVPVKCFQQKDGNFRVEYTPTVTGEHKIDVTFAEQPISGSPFICEVIDPTKVQLINEAGNPSLGQPAAVQVWRKGGGKGGLEVKVTDPKGNSVDYEIGKISGGDEEIVFVPKVVGPHQLSVTFFGYEVQNSPLIVLVEESGRPAAFGEGLKKAVVHEPAKFTIDAKKSKGGLKVDISGPNYKAKHTTSKKDGILEIGYTPIEAGFHTVNILWNNKAISGSPFSVPVIDPSRVRIVGSGLDTRGNIPMNINVEKQLSIDAVEAGPGELRAEVRGPNGRVPSSVDDLGAGKYRLAFTPQVDGEHSVYLHWSEIPVPSCPVQGWAELPAVAAVTTTHVASSKAEPPPPVEDMPGEPDHLNVVLRGEGLSKAKTKEEAEFIVDGSEAGPGTARCKMMGQKADIPVHMNHLGNNVWRATYTPQIPGAYTLEVLWSDRPVRGSPFKVGVGVSGDASKVIVSTESLKMGIVGQELKTQIDTRLAGAGHLTAQCIGPNKLAYCELYDHKDGTYTLCIKPSETGKHTLVIKYSDDHVPGSPYTLHISNPPDASKVRIYGPGIEHGILSRFKSNFVVETKGAGAGQLTVRVRGPKGAFNVEMQREKKQDRTIHCKYEPREPGDYQLEVKWAGEHVPGSPFMVMIFDTQQELERYLAGQPPSPMPQMPYLPPGWVGPPPPGVMYPAPGPFPPGQGMPVGQGPPMMPPPTFPQRGMPYANSTIYSTSSSKQNKFLAAQNGY